MSGPRLRAIGAHFVVAVLAGFIAVSAMLFSRAAVVAVETVAQAQLEDQQALQRALRIPVVVRLGEPTTPETIAKARDVLARLDGVVAAAAMSPERAASLLTQAGASVLPEQIPTLGLIEATVEARMGDPRLVLAQALASEGLAASIDAPPTPALPPRSAAAQAPPLRDLIMGASLLMIGLSVILVWLAARAQAQVAGAAAVINADIGAPLSRTLTVYGRTGAAFGFRAGAYGALAAVVCVVIALVSLRGGPTLGDLWVLIGRMELMIVFGGPLLIMIAAVAGARAGGADIHRKAERLG
jgi:hypothetical protein